MSSAFAPFAALDARLALDCRALSLRGHERLVHIGVHEFERGNPQRVIFDVDLCVRLDHAPALQDRIDEVLDYDFVRDLIGDIVQAGHVDLQETLCDGILHALLAHPKVQAARVATSKPDVYPDCAGVGTERLGVKPW